MRAWLTLCLIVAGAPLAHAQVPDELPPGHPQVDDPLPPGHPQVDDQLPPGHPQVDDQLPPGHPQVDDSGGDPHGGGGAGIPSADFSRAMASPSVSHGGESDTLPAGTIRVTVVDETGQPQAGAEVQLGVMRAGGDRERTPATTGADGIATYADLPTGQGQAYRVNVLYQGATYSSTPFQLPPTRGYDVTITRLPTSHDQRQLLMVIGQTFVELHEERLHVVEEMQLSNLGERTVVFPEDGLMFHLPEGWLAFQTQPVMTDQHLTEVADEGVALHGSLPPGRVTLVFAYDLPIAGTEMHFDVALPVHAYIYRVIADAPQGLSLDVEGFPRAIHFEDQGRALLGTELQRQPGDPQLSHLAIRLTGIPGPGPLRWIALALAALFVLGGIVVATRDGGAGALTPALLSQRKRELLADLRALDEELEAGEIGPQYRQSRRDALVRRLAGLLREEEKLASKNVTAAAARRNGSSKESTTTSG